MIKNSILAICTLPVIVLAGCSSFDESVYEYHPPVSAVEKPLSENCYVMPVLDLRPASQKEHPVNMNDDLCVNYIPLWFYSKQEINPLVKFDYFRPDLQDMMQILIARDLRFSGIFQNVKMVRFEENSEKPVFGHVLKINIKEAVWNRNLTTYGLMFTGAFLWGIGLPVSYGNVSMELEAELVEAQTKEVLAKGSFRAETDCKETMFSRVEYNPSIAEDRLCRIFPDVASQIRAFVLKNIKGAGQQ